MSDLIDCSDHKPKSAKSRIAKEELRLDQTLLYQFDGKDAHLYRDDGSAGPVFPLDSSRSVINYLASSHGVHFFRDDVGTIRKPFESPPKTTAWSRLRPLLGVCMRPFAVRRVGQAQGWRVQSGIEPRRGRQPQSERFVRWKSRNEPLKAESSGLRLSTSARKIRRPASSLRLASITARSPRAEPGPMIQGEVLKDDRGRAKLFPTAEKALAAGIQEVKSRLRLPPKAYAVGLPYGNKPKEFDAYVKLLQQQGITIDDSTRVEDSFGRKWPHVWNDRGEAEQFANRLRHVTGNRDWEVYDLSPPRTLAGGRTGDPVLSKSWSAARETGPPTASTRTA